MTQIKFSEINKGDLESLNLNFLIAINFVTSNKYEHKGKVAVMLVSSKGVGEESSWMYTFENEIKAMKFKICVENAFLQKNEIMFNPMKVIKNNNL